LNLEKQFIVRVEKDDKDKFCHMVAIRDDSDRNLHLVGVPLRGATKREATEALQSIRFAFEYGLGAALSVQRNIEFEVREDG
jgi:hypothetical protein